MHLLQPRRQHSARRWAHRRAAARRAGRVGQWRAALHRTGRKRGQNYGLRANAMRTLERAFSTLALATLAVRRGVAVQESAAFAEAAAQAASVSRDAWRRLLEGRWFLRVLPRRDADRCDRAHAHRRGAAARAARADQRRRGAGRGLGVRLVAVAAHAAGLVRRRLRIRGGARSRAASSCCGAATPAGHSSAA